jgi:DNA-binding transcriptional MerR regulator
MLEKKTYTKDQAVEKLGVQPYIMALWEKQFGILTVLAEGQPSYYEEDLEKLTSIKELLYEKGFSIDVAKKYLSENPGIKKGAIIAASPLLFESKKERTSSPLESELKNLRDQLIRLKNIL